MYELVLGVPFLSLKSGFGVLLVAILLQVLKRVEMENFVKWLCVRGVIYS